MSGDDAAYEALTRRISERAGLSLEAYKDKCLRRRIAVRMRACGVHTYADYETVLERMPGEVERLRDAITINVTRFYRNAETWDAVRRDVLPAIWQERGGRLAAWSAGCASGEEPYTLAMLLAELADREREGSLAGLTIDATDIDRGSLERATAARYRREALMELPADLATRYLVPVGDEYAVVPRVRSLVAIRTHDLTVGGPPRAAYDLILCRNVVIYFDRPMQERLFAGFVDALTPGGYLVLGKVETLFGPARDRLTLVDPRERIYRRPR